VVFLKIIIRIQAPGAERPIVTEGEITCKEVTELVTDYLEQRLLPPAERTRFEQHLSVCPGCMAYLDQMRITVKTLGTVPPREIPESIKSGLLGAFRSWKNSR